jgi:acyl-CoA thioester hydrolase
MGTPFRHISKVHIRFSDIDAFGHVNNARYLTYYEEARVLYFEEVVDWNYDWSKKGIILARAEVDFVRPVHFKDDVYIRTRCSRIGNKSFNVFYEMYLLEKDNEVLLSSCTTVMVMFDYETKQSIPVLDEWKAAIAKFETIS